MWGFFCTTHLGLNSERRQRMTHWQTPVYNHGKNTVGFNKLQQTSIYFCIWVIISLYHTSHFRASHERWKSPQINKKTILFLCSCFSRTGSWGKKCNTKQQWLLQVMLISEKKNLSQFCGSCEATDLYGMAATSSASLADLRLFRFLN